MNIFDITDEYFNIITEYLRCLSHSRIFPKRCIVRLMISVFLTFLQSVAQLNTEKAVSLIQRNMSLIYGQRKNFFELKKVLLIQKKFL